MNAAQEQTGLRHAVLPLWYAGTMGGLAASYILIVRGAPFAVAAWIATLIIALPALFLIELAGSLRFKTSICNYTWLQRGRFLAGALLLWIGFGVFTVVAGTSAGAAVLSRLPVLMRFSGKLDAWPHLLRIAVPFLFLDLWSYARHRMEHAGRERNPLWRLVHWRHHTPSEVNLWTGMTIHPVEVVLVFAGPSFLLGALGFARWELLFLFSLFLVITSPQHMNGGWTSGAFGVLITGPEAHTRHHSSAYEIRNTNFADCLTIWDRLFGTFAPNDGRVFQGPFGSDG